MEKTNIEMRKAIDKRVKYVDNFEIKVWIWDNDTGNIDLLIDVYTEDDEDYTTVNYAEFPFTEDGHKQAIVQAKKLYTYLKKHYENTIINTEILHA